MRIKRLLTVIFISMVFTACGSSEGDNQLADTSEQTDEIVVNNAEETIISSGNKLPDIIENLEPKSSKLTSQIKLSRRYEELGFLNFNIKTWEADDYIVPEHSLFVSYARCALGGVGECFDENNGCATFSEGNLVAYDYIDNHMEAEFIKAIQTLNGSACLYKYNIDLFTVSDAEELNIPPEKTTIDYYVLFFTSEEKIYMAYFNCEYFTEEEAVETISAL